ncbi:MICOS complex subunit Mic60-like isoform X1 [Sitophilus oryzae]|uniref:MICOS complex subunit MIC60 n=1 Tax=Sitophilus oryzae TaxID=7048 RepID=A0A6J2YYI9_SITOR|nr:MICOS complex subunit Mic60-like isoform X1 [Sitophilus oryzae]
MLMLKVVRKLLIRRAAWNLLNLPQSNPKCITASSCISNGNGSFAVTVRQYSDKSICPPGQSPKSKGDEGGSGGKFLLTLGAIALAGGATLAYAKYDENFRKTLTTYVPFTGTILDTLDNKSLSDLYSDTKKSVLGSIVGEDKVEKRKKDIIPPPKEYKAPSPILPALKKECKDKEESYNEIWLEEKDEGSDEPKVNIAGDPKPRASETDTKALAELEEKICLSATEAVNAYNKAVHVLLSYNQDIEHIIDEAVNQVRPEVWEDVRQKTKSKTECIKRAEEKAEQATKDVNRLKELISSPNFVASENTKVIIRNNISKVQDDVETAKKEYQSALKHGDVSEKYWDKVERARKNFSEELEILFPNIDLGKKKLVLNQEELDLFILHVYANVLFYQKELAKMETLLQGKVEHAVEAAKKGGLEPLTIAQICEAVEQEKRRLTACFQQQVLKLRKDAEIELREQLKRQSQAFNDHLNEAIKTREEEIERILTRRFDEQLEEERCKFKMQVATMVGRLHGLDESIKARNDADASSKQAQVLWSACQSLLRAVRAGCPGIPWKDQIRPLEPEINAVVRAAAENDELVCVVIEGIPKEAKERGVYPEDALRERFLKVEKVARTVDLIPAEGAALPVHILSYIQSLLLIKAASPIPRAELNDEKIDFSKLSTNDILQRARYWLDRGDFAQALKYMNLLKGAPRCVARQWMNETRILLETQQAANTLMAHAASSGLMYL